MPTLTAIYEEPGANDRHRFLRFGDKPLFGLESEGAFLVVEHFLKKVKQSRKRWRRDRNTYSVNWSAPKGKVQTSKEINYLVLVRHLRTNGRFEPQFFNLPDMECFWLDVSFPIKMNFHTHDETGTLTMNQQIPLQQYGKGFPINPSLQREGHLYGSFQPHLIRRIISLRTRLVENSHLAIEDDWIFDLRSLISDTVSLVDIALNQLHIKAEYDPLPSWTFDKSKLGDRHGRRMNDKLKWVHLICGKAANIQAEEGSLKTLREVRNHLMHFDPPCLVITIEEAAEWLNKIIDVGKILVKMRKAIGVEISTDLVTFLVQKEVFFDPMKPGWKRKPLRSNPREDYASSTWP
jgi:hypothetical protein